jgi:hypothetical protein
MLFWIVPRPAICSVTVQVLLGLIRIATLGKEERQCNVTNRTLKTEGVRHRCRAPV